MLSGKLELNEKKKEIETALSELDKSETELKTQEEQLEEGEKNLLALPAAEDSTGDTERHPLTRQWQR